MAKFFTSSKLIANVKLRAMIPVNQNTFTDEDFLQFANEEMVNELVPDIMRLHEDYLLYTTRVPIISGKNRYRIPERAMGNKLRDVSIRDATGRTIELTRILVDDISDYQGSLSVESFGRLRAFYVENNEIVFVGNQDFITFSGDLEFTYYVRPNALVAEDQASFIFAISNGPIINDRPTRLITLPNRPFPENFQALDVQTGLSIKYDIIQSKSPFVHLAIDLTPLSIDTTGRTLTFYADDVPSEVAVGDVIAIAEETIIPQVPQETHSILSHKVAMRCQEAMGDMQALQMAEVKHQRMQDRMTSLLDNRVEAAPKKIRNRFSPLRNATSRRAFRRGR